MKKYRVTLSVFATNMTGGTGTYATVEADGFYVDDQSFLSFFKGEDDVAIFAPGWLAFEVIS